MLSKYDIQMEMLKGNICVVPFKLSNLKENSINLCTSDFAYTFKDYEGDFEEQRINLEKGKSAVVEIDGKKKIILLPNTVTWIETKEVIYVSNKIGGAYHSKVGVALKGIGHIGTMLGPNFKGHSLIALMNNTDEVIGLNEGESFVSITFDYLKTPIKEENPTKNGHEDKFSTFGVIEPRMDELNEDWKSKSNQIQEKFKQESDYIKMKNEFKISLKDRFLSYISMKNLLIFTAILLILVLIIYLFHNLYKDDKNSFINIFIGVCLIPIFLYLFKKINRKF